MADLAAAELARLTELLRTVIRISDIPVSEIERRMEQSAGYVSRIFSGAIALKARHIFELLDAIELHPSEFFHLAYPTPSSEPSPTARKMRALATTLTAGMPRPEPAAANTEQLQELIATLRAFLAESGAGRAPAAEGEQAAHSAPARGKR